MANDHVIISYSEAKARGLTQYFTGKPCINGHTATRKTCSRGCMECQRIGHAKWYLKNSDQKLAKNKQYLKDHPEMNRRNALRWRNKNIQKARDIASRWYADNPEKRRELARQKRERKPEVYLAHQNNRRARKIAAGGTHTADDLVAILEAQNFRCAYCPADLRKEKRHIDHIMPLARGGSNDKNNLQYTCSECNLKKRDKDPAAFAHELGRLL